MVWLRNCPVSTAECRWAQWRGDAVSADASLVDLPEDEQVARGQELLQMLNRSREPGADRPGASLAKIGSRHDAAACTGRGRAKPSACGGGGNADRLGSSRQASPEVRVVVKHTFIELVLPKTRRRARSRALTDSELFDGLGEDREEPWHKVSDSMLSDLSDVSTDEPWDPSEDAAAALQGADTSSTGDRDGNVCCAVAAKRILGSEEQLVLEDDVEEGHQPHPYRAAAAAASLRQMPPMLDPLCPEASPQDSSLSAEMCLADFCAGSPMACMMPAQSQCLELMPAQSQCMEAWWMPMGNSYEGPAAMPMVCPAPGEWHWAPLSCSLGMCDGSVESLPMNPCEADAYHFESGAAAFGADAAFHGRECTVCSDNTTSAGASDEESSESHTTVMLRNIPNNYSREMLLSLIDKEGFASSYDFVYLPIDFSSQAGLGYAFVNFVTSDDAERCQQHFEGFCDWSVPSEKVCSVTWAGPHQGLRPHVERYRNSPVMHDTVPDEWKPAVFVNGTRTPFPPPTQPIRKPKIRRRPEGTVGSARASPSSAGGVAIGQ